MSDLNEALLSDDNDDCVDIEESLEEALLQDDPEDNLDSSRLGESKSNQKNLPLMDVEEEKSSRQDKFATERKPITAPEPADDNKQPVNNTLQRFNRGCRGGKFQQEFRSREERFQQGRQFNHPNKNKTVQNGSPRSKTVFINRYFQGSVNPKDNAARLAWDSQQQQRQQIQPNPWINNNVLGNMMQGYQHQQFQQPMQQIQGLPQMQPMQNMGPSQMHPMQCPPQMQPMQNMSPQLQYVPQPQPSFGGPQQVPMKPPNLQPPCWNGHMQVSAMPLQSANHHQGMVPYMYNNYEPQPIIINTATPPPSMQGYHFNNQFNQNMAPRPQQQPEYMPNIQCQNTRQVSANNHRHNFHDNLGQNSQESFSPKRKVGVGAFSQNKKRVQERLGVKMPQVKLKNVPFKKTDNRPSVVTEVTVTEVTTVKIEDDEATNELRRKIEEQKRKRQEILKWKELRRLENLKQAEKEQKNEAHVQVNNIRPVQRLTQSQMQGRGGHQQQNRMQKNQAMSNRKTVLHQLTEAVHHPTPTGRGGQSSKMARNARGVLSNRVVSIVAPLPATSTTSLRKPPEEDDGDVKLDKVHLSNFLESRKVLVADKALMQTRKVVIRNIATSTRDKKIITICKDIGEVQKLQRDNNERQATITFKSVASAHAFYKKYQRHLLDLSMIEVTLIPESTHE